MRPNIEVFRLTPTARLEWRGRSFTASATPSRCSNSSGRRPAWLVRYELVSEAAQEIIDGLGCRAACIDARVVLVGAAIQRRRQDHAPRSDERTR